MIKLALKIFPRPFLIRMSYVFKYFAPILLKGDNVECPVCEKKFKKFLAYGYGAQNRPNVLCPHDFTLERHRLMWYYLKNHSNFFTAEGLKVMHVAPEQCFLGKFKKQKNLEYVTSDLESPIADMHFDLHDIPLEDNQYDVIFCNHVMEHVDDYHRCMQELLRIMKPGGWGIMQVPIDYTRTETYEDPTITDPKEREKHFWQYDHVRLFAQDYPDKLRNAGFEVENFEFKKEMEEEYYKRYRFQDSEILYIVRKPNGK